MKVLQLCLKPPKPPKDGGCIAIDNISKGLMQLGVDLKILTLSTHKHPFREENYDAAFLKQSKIEAVYIDTKVNMVDAFSNIVTSDSYNVSRFFSTDFDILLRKTLESESYDIVHLESVFMTTYCHTIRRFSKAKIVLRSHNLEHVIWERMADQTSNTLKRLYLKLLSKQLKKYELNVFESIDGLAAITGEDSESYQKLGFKKKIEVIPFGIDISDYHFRKNDVENTIKMFHLGALDWKPNLEGINWFLNECWEKIEEQTKIVDFTLAGRNIPDDVFPHKSERLFNRGEVENAIDFISSQNVMLVPLLSAGGMRVKIIEGMALGKVVVSTSVGAEGVPCEHRKNIILADSPEELARELKYLEENPDQIVEIGREARKLIEKYFDNEVIMRNLYGFYASLFGY